MNSPIFLTFYSPTAMKKLYLTILAAFALLSCTDNRNDVLIIKGKVKDSMLNGYPVYFRPQPFPTDDIVLSSTIKNGKFEFRIPADSLYVGDIVLTRSLDIQYEKLLIAVEPGVLNVNFGPVSSSGGTPLNDTLQCWKNYITENVLSKMSTEPALAQKNFNTRTTQLIKDHPDAFGGYIYFINAYSLNAAQVRELDSLGLNKLFPDVTKRKIQFNR